MTGALPSFLSIRSGFRLVAGVVFLLALCMSERAALAQGAGGATEPPVRAEQAPPEGQAQPAPEQTAPPAAVPGAPRNPGFLESLGRWVDESVTGMGKGLDDMWQGAARNSSEAAKASTEVTSNLARGAADAAKGTVDMLGRFSTFGATRVATGRERCTLSSNGSPDCREAVASLCKSKGFGPGKSMELETVERCPAHVLLRGGKKPGDCPVEHIVTRAMCQ